MYFTTVKQVADEAHVSVAAVYGWINRGLLRPTRMGSKYRITPQQWEAFISRCNPEEEK